MKPHSFDPLVAKEIGIECAILLYNIEFWIEKNKANNKHFYEGKYWTYNSTKAFAEQFPYMSERVIYKTLQKLIEKGYIIKGNFNKNSFDRTCWYALGEKFDITTEENPNYQMGESILPNGKMEITTRKNDINVSNINHIENTDINTDFTPYIPQGENECLKAEKQKASEYSEEFETFWKNYPKHINKKLAFKAWNTCLKAKVNAGMLIAKAKEYAELCKARQTQEQYIKYPQAWLNGACYENDYSLSQQDKQRQAVMQRGSSDYGANEIYDDDRF